LILTLYLTSVAVVRPWKVPLMNFLEIILSVLMITTMIVAKTFLEQPTNLTTDSFDFALQVLFCCVASICGIFLLAAMADVLTRGKEGRPRRLWFLGTNIDPAQLADEFSRFALDLSSAYNQEWMTESMRHWQVYDLVLVKDTFAMFAGYGFGRDCGLETFGGSKRLMYNRRGSVVSEGVDKELAAAVGDEPCMPDLSADEKQEYVKKNCANLRSQLAGFEKQLNDDYGVKDNADTGFTTVIV